MNKIKIYQLIIIGVVVLIAGIAIGFFVVGNKKISVDNSSKQTSLKTQTKIESAINSTVLIKAGAGNTNRNQKKGCGVIYNRHGYIITNRHVVNGATKIIVKIGNKEFGAELIGEDKDFDIAVIKVEDSGGVPATLADFSKVSIGDEIRVIGRMFNDKASHTLTSGIVSSMPYDLPKGWPTMLAIDAIVNQGNSGGPVVNMDGEVIAITTAYQSTGTQSGALGFAIPIDVVQTKVKEIIK